MSLSYNDIELQITCCEKKKRKKKEKVYIWMTI